jgi:hypothetical protein
MAEIEAAGRGQVLVFTAKKLGIGEDGQRRGAGLHVAQRGALHGGVLVNPALGRRLPLEFGNQAAAVFAQQVLAQRQRLRLEIEAAFEQLHGHQLAARGHFFALMRDDGIENGGHFLFKRNKKLSVILSIAKDLLTPERLAVNTKMSSRDKVLRCAQDDRRSFLID